MATADIPMVERPVPARTARALPFVLYGMTGFTGLLAEQGLEKYIALLVGATATASAVVVFTYFLGFALGGLATARWLRKGRIARPLQLYAALEVAVGLACVAFSFALHPMIAALAPLQTLAATELGRYTVRFACGCLLVMPIAALMGASFPLVAQAVDDDHAETRNWSLAYSANLAGGAIAAVAAPYFLIPAVGLRGAMWTCLAICAAVAALAWSRGEPPQEPDAAQQRGELDSHAAILLIASFLSGAIFFALEIIWTHLIGAVIGGNVYAFSAMLATVLSGLLIGSWLANGRRVPRISFLLQLCALALVVQLWLWDLMPVLFVVAPREIYQHFYPREFYRLCAAMLLIVPPAAMLGMIYPRLLRSPLRGSDSNAWLAGYLAAANAAGCLSGTLLATFFLVPALGSETSIKILILILAALCLAFRFRETRALNPRMVAVLSVAMFTVAAVPRHWDWNALTSGASMYFGEAGPAGESGAPLAPAAAPTARSIIFRDERIQGGFTTVVEQKSASGKVVRSLYSDGKLQGNDDPQGDLPIQFGVAAIPTLYAPRFDRALLIGLGIGRTAYVLKELGFDQLQIAELSPGIVRAADAEFGDVNHGVLHAPGVSYTLEDGRNLLLINRGRPYDLITVELTAIWFAGATNLYSKEFYELAKAQLEPDGVLQQWVQLHRISPAEIGSAIAAARSVFPHVSFWSYAGQGMLLAANRPLTEPSGREDALALRLSAGEHIPIGKARERIATVAASRLVSESGIDALVGELHPAINTDHNRIIEYATPRYASSERDWHSYNVAFLKRWDR